MGENSKILISTIATIIQPKDSTSKERVAPFLRDIENAGFLNTQELFLELKATGKLPQDFKDAKGHELTIAFKLHAMGAEATDVFRKVDESNILNEEQKGQLYRAALIMSALEDVDQERFGLIRDANLNPEIEIRTAPFKVQYPQPNQLLLNSQDNTLTPVIKEVTGRVADFAKNKLKNYALKAFEKGGNKVVQNLLSKAAQKGLTKVVTKGLTAIGAKALGGTIGTIIGGPIGTVIGAAIGWLLEKAGKLLKPLLNGLKKILGFITGEKDLGKQLFYLGLVGLGIGVLTGSAPLVLLSGGLVLGVIFFLALISISIASILTPILIAVIVVPVVVALILFIINSGAYLVPPGSFETRAIEIGPIPPGGLVGNCDQETAGNDITQQLARRINSGVVRFLPDTVSALSQNQCFTPTLIVLHSSGGYDNDVGNDRTYETLIRGNDACQLATDTNDTYLMMHFYERQVQLTYSCANGFNTSGISIELAGECIDGERPCARNYSACQVGDDSYPYIFNNPPPHPCPNETDLAVDALCKIMDQYNIPVTQIYQHQDAPGATHTDPVGDSYVEYLIGRIRNTCPNPER